jgi:hypothetical protein
MYTKNAWKVDFLELRYIPDFSNKSGICPLVSNPRSPIFNRLQYNARIQTRLIY